MRKSFLLFLFLATALSYSQEEVVHSVYFEFDKFSLSENQKQELITFIRNSDSTRTESIEIFGYTDDIGKDDYNFKLSSNRANAIQQELLNDGVKNKIIVTIEGKGRILIDDDIVENLPVIRSKNRRVDIVLNLKELPKIEIPGFFTVLGAQHIVGDHIYLENLLFPRGSSKLTLKSKTELDKIARILHRNKKLHFEIQGHVCCVAPYQKEAIDKDTRKRQLSQNRAESVYKYLVSKKIDKKRMTFKGYGNTIPLGKSVEYDRRVELVITKN